LPLYLRRVKNEDGLHHVIRSSYREGECWKSRDLLDLGLDPGEYIVYPGGNGFYFEPDLEERLLAQGELFTSDDLEHLFLPFLRPEVRRVVESYRHRSGSRDPQDAPSSEEFAQRQRHLHSFDKRRLHFLRCGRVDIGDLDGRPWGFLKVLMEKSRDEIEHVIEGMERVLRPQEVCSYVFTALHLQTKFPHHPWRNRPAALDQDEVDQWVLAALCDMNTDETFFAGVDRHDGSRLHPYLVKYLVLYFDAETAGGLRPEDLREILRRQRFSPPRPAVPRMGVDAACRLFGISRERMVAMERKELVRLYRRKAKELHPDRGGDQESFIRLSEAFTCLVEGKKR